jgi:hypothetical protein
MSIVFSVSAALISFKDLSATFETAGFSTLAMKSGLVFVREVKGYFTFFGHNVYDGILVDHLHYFHSTVPNCGNEVYTPHSSLTISSGVEQRSLEMSVQFGIQFAIVAEQDTDRLISINGAHLEVRSERMLKEIAMV